MSILSVLVASPPSYSTWTTLLAVITVPLVHILLLHIFDSSESTAPPSASYRIPFYDHTRAFAEGGARLYKTLKQHTGTTVPLCFDLPGTKVVLISSPGLIRETLYNTAVFTTHRLRSRFVRNVLKFTKKAARIIENDSSGAERRPLPGSHVAPEDRILRMQHETTFDLISSKEGMEATITQFSRVFDEELAAHEIGEQWVKMDNLFAFIRHLAGTAGITALCGPGLIREQPDFLDLFWDFDRNMHFYHMGYPGRLKPQAERVRQTCVDAISRWRKNAVRDSSGKAYPEGLMWDEIWGLKAMRLRNEMYDRFPDIDDTGRSGADLGFLWAANCNMVNTIYYFILALLRDSSLRDRCLEEMRTAWIPDDYHHLPRFDYKILMKQPLLQSVLNETLRTEVTSLIARTIEQDHPVKNYTLPKNALSCVSIAVEHNDPSRWETRPGAAGHPVSQFWPERFLNPQDTQSKCPQQAPELAMSGLEATFIPFGIGHYMCPGRHFAVRTVLTVAAMFVAAYEVEEAEAGSWNDEERDYTTFGYAVLRPVNATPFRIRKRARYVGWSAQ